MKKKVSDLKKKKTLDAKCVMGLFEVAMHPNGINWIDSKYVGDPVIDNYLCRSGLVDKRKINGDTYPSYSLTEKGNKATKYLKEYLGSMIKV